MTWQEAYDIMSNDDKCVRRSSWPENDFIGLQKEHKKMPCIPCMKNIYEPKLATYSEVIWKNTKDRVTEEITISPYNLTDDDKIAIDWELSTVTRCGEP